LARIATMEGAGSDRSAELSVPQLHWSDFNRALRRCLSSCVSRVGSRTFRPRYFIFQLTSGGSAPFGQIGLVSLMAPQLAPQEINQVRFVCRERSRSPFEWHIASRQQRGRAPANSQRRTFRPNYCEANHISRVVGTPASPRAQLGRRIGSARVSAPLIGIEVLSMLLKAVGRQSWCFSPGSPNGNQPTST